MCHQWFKVAIRYCSQVITLDLRTDKIQNNSMNFIYKSLFTLPNLRPYTKHKKRIIPAMITGRISSFFLLLSYTSNSLCWLDGGPPYKNVVKSWGSSRKLGVPPTLLPSGCALARNQSDRGNAIPAGRGHVQNPLSDPYVILSCRWGIPNFLGSFKFQRWAYEMWA